MDSKRTRRHTILMCTVALVVSGAILAARRDSNQIPETVRKAITALFPSGRVIGVETERHIIRLLEVSVLIDGREKEVTLTEDGIVVEVEEEIDADAIPDSVMQSLRELSQKGELTELERKQIYAQFQWVRLKSPRTEYEAEFHGKGRKHEVSLGEDGKIVGEPLDDDQDKDDHDDDNVPDN